MMGADVDAVLPLDPPQRVAGRQVIDEAFVSSCRFVMLCAATLALAVAAGAAGGAIR